jgi:putative transposase
MSELCRRFGVSRKTGYEVLARWRAEGPAGLAERSHAPHHRPHALSKRVREAIVGLRGKRPTWGPKKLKRHLELDHPDVAWPAASTIGDLLARMGVVARRKRLRQVPPRTAPLAHCQRANDVWSVDFKGWFRTLDGSRCDPLTMQDQASRYLLRVVAVERMDADHVWAVFDAAFREFGLPVAVRSDNGPPFASTGAGGLSRLAVRLIKAGVVPERIDAGCPQQNGRLERLHLTLAQETARPPAASLRAQARSFDAFCQVYNEERPHEALGLAVPASVYVASARSWNGRLCSPEYASGVAVRRVRMNGEIKWGGGLVWISSALIGEPIGIEEGEDGLWRVWFGTSGAAPERMENSVTHHPG